MMLALALVVLAAVVGWLEQKSVDAALQRSPR
jgi:hypothetical protein